MKPVNRNTQKVRRLQIREMLARGEIEEAGAKANEWNLTIEDCQMESHMDGTPEMVLDKPIKPATKLAVEKVEPPPPAPDMSSWPVETEAYVYAYPINKRQILIKLKDGRQAHFWRSSTQQYPIGALLKVRLMDRVGPEAYYELAY